MLVDLATGSPVPEFLVLQAENLEHLLMKLAERLAEFHDGSARPHVGELRGCLMVNLEVLTWTSSRSCEEPGEEERSVLHAMRSYVRERLFSGAGSPRPGTATGSSGCCPN
jgi:hypothetical protein